MLIKVKMSARKTKINDQKECEIRIQRVIQVHVRSFSRRRNSIDLVLATSESSAFNSLIHATLLVSCSSTRLVVRDLCNWVSRGANPLRPLPSAHFASLKCEPTEGDQQQKRLQQSLGRSRRFASGGTCSDKWLWLIKRSAVSNVWTRACLLLKAAAHAACPMRCCGSARRNNKTRRGLSLAQLAAGDGGLAAVAAGAELESSICCIARHESRLTSIIRWCEPTRDWFCALLQT